MYIANKNTEFFDTILSKLACVFTLTANHEIQEIIRVYVQVPRAELKSGECKFDGVESTRGFLVRLRVQN